MKGSRYKLSQYGYKSIVTYFTSCLDHRSGLGDGSRLPDVLSPEGMPKKKKVFFRACRSIRTLFLAIPFGGETGFFRRKDGNERGDVSRAFAWAETGIKNAMAERLSTGNGENAVLTLVGHLLW